MLAAAAAVVVHPAQPPYSLPSLPCNPLAMRQARRIVAAAPRASKVLACRYFITPEFTIAPNRTRYHTTEKS